MGLPLCEILWLSIKNCGKNSLWHAKIRYFPKIDHLLRVTLTFDPRGQRSYFFLVVLIEPNNVNIGYTRLRCPVYALEFLKDWFLTNRGSHLQKFILSPGGLKSKIQKEVSCTY